MYIEGINPLLTYAVTTATPDIPGAPFAVGTRGLDYQGKEYVFCSNTTTAALVAGDIVQTTVAYAASQMTTTVGARGNPVGVVPVAVSQSTSAITYYFWAQVYGICSAIHVLASCAANVRLNTVATAGALDDDGTASTKQVQGIYLTTARAASEGTAAGILRYPFVDATL